jgi:hypothetical protein
VYLAIKCVLNKALSEDDKILDFKTYWHGYDVAGAMHEAEARHVRYEEAPDEIRQALIDCEGTLIWPVLAQTWAVSTSGAI